MFAGNGRTHRVPVDLTYRGFPGELTQNFVRYEYFGKGGGYSFGPMYGWGRGFDRDSVRKA